MAGGDRRGAVRADWPLDEGARQRAPRASSSGAGRDIYDLRTGAPPEEPQGTFYPDAGRVLRARRARRARSVDDGPDPARALIRIVDALYRTNKEFARRMLVGAIGELDAELEESAYRWRQARMADLGFADYYEALEVYRELDPGQRPASASVPGPRPDDRRRAARTAPRCGCRRRWPSGSATPTARRSRARRKS